jgi:hypothetical protein
LKVWAQEGDAHVHTFMAYLALILSAASIVVMLMTEKKTEQNLAEKGQRVKPTAAIIIAAAATVCMAITAFMLSSGR